MKKYPITVLVLIVSLGLILPCLAQDQSSFAVGPSKLNVDVSAAGTNTTFVYITSHVNGTLVVGTENLPFNVEPAAIPITAADRNRKIELTVHGNASLTAGQYLGKLTLLLQTGGNVAHGVKINASVTQQQSENVQNLYLIGIAFVVIAALTLGIYFIRSRRKLDRSRAGNDDFLKGIEPLDS